jgi:hypothetical protein
MFLSSLQEPREFEADPDAPPGNFPHTDPDDPYWSPEIMEKRHEFHPPLYAYLGPGTEYVAKKIFGSDFYEEKMRAAGRTPKGGQGPGKYDVPYNELDACAMEHDRVYTDLNSSRQDRITSDQQLLECFEKHKYHDVEQYIMSTIAYRLIQTKMGLQDIGAMDPDAFAATNLSNDTINRTAEQAGVDPEEYKEGLSAVIWAYALGMFNLLDAGIEYARPLIRGTGQLLPGVFLRSFPYYLRRRIHRDPSGNAMLLNMVVQGLEKLKSITPGPKRPISNAIKSVLLYWGFGGYDMIQEGLVASLAETLIAMLPDSMSKWLDMEAFWKKLETQPGDVEAMQEKRQTIENIRGTATQFQRTVGIPLRGEEMNRIRGVLNVIDKAKTQRDVAAGLIALLEYLTSVSATSSTVLGLVKKALRSGPVMSMLNDIPEGLGRDYVRPEAIRAVLETGYTLSEELVDQPRWSNFMPNIQQDVTAMDILKKITVSQLDIGRVINKLFP